MQLAISLTVTVEADDLEHFEHIAAVTKLMKAAKNDIETLDLPVTVEIKSARQRDPDAAPIVRKRKASE